MSPEAVERIHEAARTLNYRPDPAARSLRIGKTATVGFISDDVTVTRYASAMIRGALDVAEGAQHTVLIAETGSRADRREEALRAMLDRRPDGVIFGLMGAKMIELPPLPPDLPVVMLNSLSTAGHASVLPAEYDAGYAMGSLLVQAGHRRIGLIGHADELATNLAISATIGLRYAGINTALGQAGVTPTMRYECSDWEPEHGYLGTRAILERDPDVTGLICLNDRLAFGAYRALSEANLRVCQDVSIVSFDDDIVASYLHPGLTTAAIPYEEMGRQAMQLLLAPDRTTEQRLVGMPTRLRESVRAL
ncbi:MAG: LacI family DNA-binding transcriptional regulator [Micropruina sp.]|nr:LacI family DNA-binding transcriptional regulator [Micropruina sp.]